MIKAIGLTSAPREQLPSVVDDVSFEVLPGRVTALLGARGSGRTTVLQLMLELRPGRGVTHFRGRPLHASPAPLREVGALLGDVPGHPARTLRGHLRMLCAAAGAPAARADELLRDVGLMDLCGHRLDSLSRGGDRRLGMACALLADPHALLLDEPAAGLTPDDARWLHSTLRRRSDDGGAVLFTTADPREAARFADHVVTLHRGRVAADQGVAEFARTRLRRRVAVRSPHAERLAELLAKEARVTRRPVDVVREGGTRLSVYGGDCAEIGEAAYRHRILIHQLSEETADMGPGARLGGGVGLGVDAPGADVPGADGPGVDGCAGAGVTGVDGRGGGGATPRVGRGVDGPGRRGGDAQGRRAVTNPAVLAPAPGSAPVPGPDGLAADGDGGQEQPRQRWQPRQRRQPRQPRPAPPAPRPPLRVRRSFSPTRPLRYEFRRARGTGVWSRTCVAVVLVSAALTLLLARVGHTPQTRLLAAWPDELPLPPAALGAALLGALSFGQEFRYPALAVDRGTVPRRLGLLAAKLLVSAAMATAPAIAAVGVDALVLRLLLGEEYAALPPRWQASAAVWLALVTACAWAGVLAAGLFRSVTGGLAAVLAVPLVAAPVVEQAAGLLTPGSGRGEASRPAGELLVRWPVVRDEVTAEVLRTIGQPFGVAMVLSLAALLCGYLCTTLRAVAGPRPFRGRRWPFDNIRNSRTPNSPWNVTFLSDKASIETE
ncbi:ATP-binding cassette domain-containing protein [Streptomyces fragilis]|uniref:ABC transporter ATP-binding protein n=1 Tax=Streptomyces fragilis TaxID=67301 RepID=A0ABV2YI98_9ACTN|nr:ABC transporter ATP-binding protein [Streptomyces fragilis]